MDGITADTRVPPACCGGGTIGQDKQVCYCSGKIEHRNAGDEPPWPTGTSKTSSPTPLPPTPCAPSSPTTPSSTTTAPSAPADATPNAEYAPGATTHTTEAAPRATEAQLTYLQDLLRRCNPDNLPELPGPTTPDALAALTALTKTEASTYIDAVKRAMDPPGPARPLPRDAYPDAVRGEVTIRFAVDGTVIWKTTAPGAPEAHGTAANASETVTAVLDTVESTPYRTDDAPHGWSTPIMDRSTFKLPTGTFTLRPVTEEDVAAAQRAANRPSLRSRIGAGRRTQGEQA